MTAGLLLLADGRLPAGGHAHSGGVEAAVRDGAVHDLGSLRAFLYGRLATTGRADASVAAWVTASTTADGGAPPADGGTTPPDWASLDAEAGARIPSPALRAASRARGRQLLRLAQRAWPSPLLSGLAAARPRAGPHLTVVYGATAVAAGLSPRDVAAAVAYDAVTGPATAAVRLLALDPLDVQALLAGLADAIDDAAADAARAAAGGVPLATSGPLLDVRAEQHATWEVRLFAS